MSMVSFLLRPYFYPATPRGGRPLHGGKTTARAYFYPRPPRGGRQQAAARVVVAVEISIHALLAEGDLTPDTQRRSPPISIHALLAGGRPSLHIEHYPVK